MSEDTPLWRRDPERWVDRRAAVLGRRADLREPVARAIAWSELGYSSSGIAKRLDTGEGTVRGYLDDVEQEHGPAACWARVESDLSVDTPIGDPGGDGA